MTDAQIPHLICGPIAYLQLACSFTSASKWRHHPRILSSDITAKPIHFILIRPGEIIPVPSELMVSGMYRRSYLWKYIFNMLYCHCKCVFIVLTVFGYNVYYLYAIFIIVSAASPTVGVHFCHAPHSTWAK